MQGSAKLRKGSRWRSFCVNPSRMLRCTPGRDRFQLQMKPILTLTEVCLVFVSNKKPHNFFFQSLQLSKTWYLDVFDFCLALKASPLVYQPSTLEECFVPRYPPSQETGRVNISQSCSRVMMYSMICIM